jgi:hypothetical protein
MEFHGEEKVVRFSDNGMAKHSVLPLAPRKKPQEGL